MTNRRTHNSNLSLAIDFLSHDSGTFTGYPNRFAARPTVRALVYTTYNIPAGNYTAGHLGITNNPHIATHGKVTTYSRHWILHNSEVAAQKPVALLVAPEVHPVDAFAETAVTPLPKSSDQLFHVLCFDG